MPLSPQFIEYLEAVNSSEIEFNALSLADRTLIFNNFKASQNSGKLSNMLSNSHFLTCCVCRLWNILAPGQSKLLSMFVKFAFV